MNCEKCLCEKCILKDGKNHKGLLCRKNVTENCTLYDEYKNRLDESETKSIEDIVERLKFKAANTKVKLDPGFFSECADYLSEYMWHDVSDCRKVLKLFDYVLVELRNGIKLLTEYYGDGMFNTDDGLVYSPEYINGNDGELDDSDIVKRFKKIDTN